MDKRDKRVNKIIFIQMFLFSFNWENSNKILHKSLKELNIRISMNIL